MTTTKTTEQQEAITRLKEWLKPGDTVHTVLRHCSKSGMMRHIQVIKINDANNILYIGYNVAKALDWKYDRNNEGVKVGGCGMDMGFHLVYTLSHVLFNDGYALNQRWL